MPFLPGGPSGPTQRHSETSWRHGYEPIEVDAFREEIRDTFLGVSKSPVRSDEVRGKQFSSTDDDLAMTRSRLTRSSMPPASGWPRWSRRTGRQDHWLAVPFSPSGPSGPTQRDFQPAV